MKELIALLKSSNISDEYKFDIIKGWLRRGTIGKDDIIANWFIQAWDKLQELEIPRFTTKSLMHLLKKDIIDLDRTVNVISWASSRTNPNITNQIFQELIYLMEYSLSTDKEHKMKIFQAANVKIINPEDPHYGKIGHVAAINKYMEPTSHSFVVFVTVDFKNLNYVDISTFNLEDLEVVDIQKGTHNMKAFQTGSKIKVINPKSNYYQEIGHIICISISGSIGVEFDNPNLDSDSFIKEDLEVINT